MSDLRYNELSKEIKKISKRCCCASGSIEAGCCYEEVTYAEAAAKIAANTLVKGKMYKITDRGDLGIFLEAISENQFNQEGSRLMLIPNSNVVGYYAFWKASMSAGDVGGIGGYVKRKGIVYQNVTGDNNSEPTPNITNDWEPILKTSFSNGEYIEKWFGIIYNVATDWISKQWDEFGNIVGIPSPYQSFDSLYNPADVTQWECASSWTTPPARLMYNNNCAGGIIDNYTSGACDGVFKIYNNTTTGAIIENGVGCLEGISFNIAENIQSNIGDGEKVNIYYNNVKGSINNNTIGGGDISYNTNLGNIESNTNVGSISYNSNNGTILGNSNLGGILHNKNNGDISDNSNNFDDIPDSGLIAYNVNNGMIFGNSHLGNIVNNANNGDITDCDSGVSQCNIYDNVNNGDISNTFVADVFDAAVNK